jgi:hypothetical protein
MFVLDCEYSIFSFWGDSETEAFQIMKCRTQSVESMAGECCSNESKSQDGATE